MKKLFSIFAMLLLSVTLVACGDDDKKTTETETDTTPVAVEGSDFEDVADGLYFAAADEFANSYRYYVTLEVKDGVLIDATWDGYHQDMGVSKIQGLSKYEGSMLGLYGMDAAANNVNGKWYRQVERVIANLINTQQIDALTFNDGGKTDEVAGITIHYSEFYDLVNDAIEAGPVTVGDFKDGYYYVDLSEEADPEKPNQYEMGTFVVLNGTIVLADLNAAHPKTVNEVDYVSKDSMKEGYGMNADNPWYVQAIKVEEYIKENQGLDIDTELVDDHWVTDDIANVSISVDGFQKIFVAFDKLAGSQYAGYADGLYFAAQDGFSGGYRYYVTLEIADNRLVAAELNGYAQDGSLNKCTGLNKYECSEDGLYAMNTDNPWYEQADAITTFAIDKQKLFVNYKDEAGHTDDIAGVTIHVSEYFGLAKTALDAGPVAEGDYVDGYYYKDLSVGAEDAAKFEMGTFIVLNGTIVLADLNAAHPKTVNDVSYISKDAMKEGYGMNADNPWYIQAQKVEEYIITTQNLDIDTALVNDHWVTDDIANVSISVDGFESVFEAFVTSATPVAE